MTLPKTLHQPVIRQDIKVYNIWLINYMYCIRWLSLWHLHHRYLLVAAPVLPAACAAKAGFRWYDWGHGMALFLSAPNIWIIWSYIDIMVIIWSSYQSQKPKHDETIWNMDVWWCMLVQFNPCTVQVHVNLWRLSSTLGCSNVYDVLLSHKISRVLRLHSQSRFAASSFPMLSHDSRQPEAICRENHVSRTSLSWSSWRYPETLFWHAADASTLSNQTVWGPEASII